MIRGRACPRASAARLASSRRVRFHSSNARFNRAKRYSSMNAGRASVLSERNKDFFEVAVGPSRVVTSAERADGRVRDGSSVEQDTAAFRCLHRPPESSRLFSTPSECKVSATWRFQPNLACFQACTWPLEDMVAEKPRLSASCAAQTKDPAPATFVRPSIVKSVFPSWEGFAEVSWRGGAAGIQQSRQRVGSVIRCESSFLATGSADGLP